MMWQASITVVYGEALLQRRSGTIMLWITLILLLCSVVETTMSVQVSTEIIICPTEIGSYCMETVLNSTEIGAVSLEMDYHTTEIVIIVVSFVFWLATPMNRMMRGRY